MADFSLTLDGLDEALRALEDLEDDVSTLATFTVGTGVSYSVFLEFGSSKMDAKPFFRPAISEVRTQGVDGFIARNTRTSVEALPDADAVLRVLALALERRIKEIITEKSLIDTGTLRASVVAVRGGDPSRLPSEGDFGDDGVPQSAGRAVAEEVVEI